MRDTILIVVGAALTVLPAWGIGRAVIHFTRAPFRRQEESLFAFLGGAAIMSAVIWALGMAGLYHNVYFWVLRFLGLALGWVYRPRQAEACPTTLPRAWRWGFYGLFAVFAVIGICHAVAPETSPDGSGYHLGSVGAYLRAHGMDPMPNHMYAHLSQGLEMLFLLAYSLGRHSAAASVHAVFWLVLPWLMLRFAQRFGVPRAGAAAAIIAFVTPIVVIDGTSAYNDVAAATVLFAIFYLTEILLETGDQRLAPWLGLLAGFAYAIKYTAGIGAIYAAVVLIWKLRRLRPILIFAAGAAIIALPWPLRNYAFYGNPFSPLMNRYFPNPFITLAFEQDYQEGMRWYNGLGSWRDLPMELTIRGRVLGGFLGPLFLLSPLALLSAVTARGRRLLVAALLFGAPYAMNVGTRFLIPAVPLVAMAMMLAWTRFPMIAAVLAVAHAVASYPPVMPHYADKFAWRVDKILWRQALHIEPEEHYLLRVNPEYLLMRLIESRTRKNAVIFTLRSLPEAFTSREVRLDYESADNQRLSDALMMPMTVDYQRSMLSEFRFEPRKLRRVRVVQTARARDFWSVFEMRVFHEGHELPRLPEWRLRSWPNIWDIQMAFDNSPATRWRSAQRIEPGMFIEIDYGREEMVDAVTLEASTDQWNVRLKLEGQNVQGKWETLSEAPTDRGLPAPLGLRREAIQMLKAHDVTHLVVHGSHPYAEDFMQRQDLWGMRQIAELGGTVVYLLR